MSNLQSFKQIKANARQSLDGHYGSAIAVLLATELMSLIPTYIILLFFSGSGLIEVIASELINLILSAFIGLFQVGTSLFFLKLACKQQASVSDIFHGFYNNRNHGLEVSVVFSLVTFVCLLPYSVVNYYIMYSGNFVFSWVLYPILILGYLLCLVILIPLRQSYYILLDFPNYTGKQAMQYSIRLMKGHFLRYGLFVLSFVPLIMLGILSCGIGLFWVLPYMEASLTAFYLDLIKNYCPKRLSEVSRTDNL